MVGAGLKASVWERGGNGVGAGRGGVSVWERPAGRGVTASVKKAESPRWRGKGAKALTPGWVQTVLIKGGAVFGQRASSRILQFEFETLQMENRTVEILVRPISMLSDVLLLEQSRSLTETIVGRVVGARNTFMGHRLHFDPEVPQERWNFSALFPVCHLFSRIRLQRTLGVPLRSTTQMHDFGCSD